MAVGSDDTLTVWLNGKEVYKFSGNRGYSPDSAHFDVELKKGKNLFMVKCGNGGGPWAFSVAVTGMADYAFLKGPATGGFDPDQFKAAAMKGPGQARPRARPCSPTSRAWPARSATSSAAKAGRSAPNSPGSPPSIPERS